MTRRVSRVTPIRYGLLLLAAWLATGCVMFPYKPSAEVSDTTEVELDPAYVRLTAAPRELLEELSDAIRVQDSAITVIDPQVFARAAFLDDEPRLSRLLTAPACARVREQTAADYLVLMGTPHEHRDNAQGFMVFLPFLAFQGAKKGTGRVSNFAIIVDLKTTMPLSRVNSKAEGTTLGAGYFFALFVVPLTESSAMDGLARGVIARLREVAGPDPLTIAVMRAETAGPSQYMIPARAAKPHFTSEPGPEPASSKEEALIRSIQEGLRRVGYTWVPVDGRVGSWTRAAIRDYQSSSESESRIVDGMPSVHLLVDIERAIPKWDAVLQHPLQPVGAEQK